MQYKLSTDGHRRSESYRGTVFSKDDPNVKAIKADVARHNKVIRENTRLYGSSPCGQSLQRVSIMARGTRRDAQGKLLHGNADSSLQHKYGHHFDVYIHDDYTNQYQLNREVELGMTPGELKKYDELTFAPIRYRMEIAAKKWKAENK